MSKSTITLTINSGPKQGETLTRTSKSTIRIGRVVKGNTLAIKDTSISQKHLTIHFDSEISEWFLTDLDSANGTVVNGVKIGANELFRVGDGDVLKIGESTEIFITVLIEAVCNDGRRNGKKIEVSDLGLEKLCKNDELGESVDQNANKAAIDDGAEEAMAKLKIDRKECGDATVGSQLKRKGRKQNLKKDASLDKVCEDDEFEGTLDCDSSKNLKGNAISGSDLGDGVEDVKTLGRLGKVDECEEAKDENCVSGSVNVVNVPKNVRKGKKPNVSRVLENVETLDTAVDGKLKKRGRKQNLDLASDDRIVASKNLGKGKKKVLNKVSEEKIMDTEIEGWLDQPENIEQILIQNCERAIVEDAIMEIRANDVAENLGKGRKRNCTRASKKDTVIEVPKDLERPNNADFVANRDEEMPMHLAKGRKSYCTRASKKNEILEQGLNDKFEKLGSIDENAASYVENKESVGEEIRRGKSAMILESCRGEKIELSLDKRKSSDFSNKEENVEDKMVTENLRRGRRGKSAKISVEHAVFEENVNVSKNVRRGRSIKSTQNLNKDLSIDLVANYRGDNSTSILKDVVLEDNIEPWKINRGGEIITRSTKVFEENDNSSLVNEDKVTAAKVVRRGRNKNSTMVSNIDEHLELGGEDITNSTTVSEIDDVGKKKPRTRASSRVSKAQLKSKESASSPIKNSYLLKKPRENKSKNIEDKENHVLVTENEIFGKVNDKISHALPKAWDGNGIPNSTTKYKEDQKISWHGTPFEERVERALSDDKLFPRRNITS